MTYYQNNRNNTSPLTSLCNRKAHYEKEVALIRSEMEELKEELRYKKHLIREINTTLRTINTQKTQKVELKLVYSSK